MSTATLRPNASGLALSWDWLNPMLVRDLRQGLRSRGFTFTFLSLQFGLMFFTVLGLTDQYDAIQGSLSRVFNFGMVAVFLVLLPLLATTALGAEFREGRLDLLKLTQLNSRKILWGKWVSLCTQGLLVASTLLPYIVLRYFIGGFDIVGELGRLLAILWLSALLMGAGLALASTNSLALRILVFVLLGYWVWRYLLSNQNVALPGLTDLFQSMSSEVYVALVALGLPFLWLCLELGAVRLAPLAENHDTPHRWTLPALFFVAELFVWEIKDNNLLWVTSLFVAAMAVWVMMIAATTNPSPFPDTYRPFVRFGVLGRVVGRLFLYPGWPSAISMAMLVSAVMYGYWYYLAATVPNWSIPASLPFHALLAPAILFPTVAGRLLFGRRVALNVCYLAMLIVCCLTLLTSYLVATATGDGRFLAFVCVLPPCGLLLLSTVAFRTGELETAYLFGALGAFLTMFLAFLSLVRHWRTYRELEQRAMELEHLSQGRQPLPLPTEAWGAPEPEPEAPAGPT